MTMLKKIGVAFIILHFFMRFFFERLINRVIPSGLESPSVPAQKLAGQLHFFDGHNDALLFNRDLNKKQAIGHVDFPRLAAGRVGLAVFAVATRVPLTVNHTLNSPRAVDALSLIYTAQLSRMALLPPFGRAKFQAQRLIKFAARTNYQIVTSAADLEQLDDGLNSGGGRFKGGILLALEGAHAIPALSDLDTLYSDYNFRILGLAHFFDNRYAGSAHGEQKYGLTAEGRRLIQACNRLGMVIDLAHASEQTKLEVCDLTTRPIICSHTGLRSQFESPRNLSPESALAIATTGGVCGVGFWKDVVGGNAPHQIAQAICAFVDLIGEDHVCLGSDFDGGIVTTFDVSSMGLRLIDALLKLGLKEELIAKIMWRNGYRAIRAALAPG